MAGPLKRYAYINAKLRTRIAGIIPEELVERMVRSRSLDECLQLLPGSDFAAVRQTYDQTGDIKMAERELLERELEIYLELEKQTQAEVFDLVYALAARFEVETVKNAVRLWFDSKVRRRDIEVASSYLLRRRIHYPLDIEAILNAATPQQAADALEGTPYARLLRSEAPRMLESSSPFPFEIALDRQFYSDLVEGVERLKTGDREIARRLIGVQIDLQNMSWLIRFKSYYSLEPEQALSYTMPWGLSLDPQALRQAYTAERTDRAVSALLASRYPELAALAGAKEQSGSAERLTMIDRVLEQVLNLEVRRLLLGYPFTIGIILAYFILKGNEIKKIMTILNAKYYNWPEERILAVI